MQKLKISLEELRLGWESSIYWLTILGVLWYHAFVGFVLYFLIQFCWVIFMYDARDTRSASIVIAWIILFGLEWIFYKRMVTNEFYHYCKGILIMTPLFFLIALIAWFYS